MCAHTSTHLRFADAARKAYNGFYGEGGPDLQQPCGSRRSGCALRRAIKPGRTHSHHHRTKGPSPPRCRSAHRLTVAGSAAQRSVHAALPLLQHPLSNLGKLRMLLHVEVEFSCSLLNRFCDALQNLPCLRGETESASAKPSSLKPHLDSHSRVMGYFQPRRTSLAQGHTPSCVVLLTVKSASQDTRILTPSGEGLFFRSYGLFKYCAASSCAVCVIIVGTQGQVVFVNRAVALAANIENHAETGCAHTSTDLWFADAARNAYNGF